MGRAIAIAFSRAGATVGLAGRDADALKETSENCPGRTETLRFDAANPDSCAQAAADVERLMGGVDVLVHGAGISMTSRFLRTSSDSMQQLMSNNFESSWWLTQGVLPGMLDRRRGTVPFINSPAGKVGFGQVAAYVASKHAQLGQGLFQSPGDHVSVQARPGRRDRRPRGRHERNETPVVKVTAKSPATTGVSVCRRSATVCLITGFLRGCPGLQAGEESDSCGAGQG
ncbi:SDR family NAD(P)-dependent oxidoreductase [Streptomyces sp. NPDC001982]|uniref:SDR family NAD(P)-dependent oxidoreductase n=1 Tax=Streptomyces sp. NPDC001982 TaxID=3154405 RepID=UPI0033216FA6